MFQFTLTQTAWPIRGEFRLSRGSRRETKTVQMHLTRDGFTGHAEAVPYARYGESMESVTAQIEDVRHVIESGITAEELATLLPAGAARNLCDLALWDWRAKSSGQPVWKLAGLAEPRPTLTAYTLSLAEPDVMAEAARGAAQYPLLKLKLGTPDDAARLRAIKAARPDARLIVDANEGWSIEDLLALAPVMAACDVVLCEQPLPASADTALADHRFPFLICADESIHTATDIPALADRYQAVNIKLDKAGGLSEALNAIKVAKAHNLQIMVGCMLASSLALAPAVLLAGMADWVDLDGPLLLATDTKPGLEYAGAMLLPPPRDLWG